MSLDRTDESTADEAMVEPTRTVRPSLVQRLARDKFAMAGLAVLIILAVTAIFANQLAPYDPRELLIGDKFEARSSAHWLGTDHIGRDNLSRIIFGARVAFRVALQVVSVMLIMSLPLGLLAGFKGGKFDTVTMRVMDAIHSIPTLVMALTLATAFDLSFNWAMFGISLSFTPTMTRLVRGETLAVREETFIEASYSIGTSTARVLRKRVLHNVASPIIIQTSVYAGGAILVEAGLSILGVGIQGGEAAWGTMLEEAFRSIHTNSANVAYPGIAIALTVLASNLLGDGLRDSLGLDAGSRYGARTRMGITNAAQRDMTKAAADQPTSDEGVVENVLEVEGLTVSVIGHAGKLKVVEDVSFTVKRGEILGLVGESGSGKTVTSMSIMRLLSSPPFEITNGSIMFDGEELLSASMAKMRSIRGRDIAMIFQDPMAALNPSITIGHQISETVRIHEHASKRAAERRALELLERVGIPDARSRMNNFPHEFSGGMRQRAMIAMALACSPKLLIADEPTTALDVTIQAQIIELLRDLQRDLGLSIIFVTHDLGVVADVCDRVMVMYAGKLVEHADVYDLYRKPTHPYTSALLAAMPRLSDAGKKLFAIPGSVPVGIMPSGCRFHPRCRYAIDACKSGEVPMVHVDASWSRCIRAEELDLAPVDEPAVPADTEQSTPTSTQ